MRQYSSILGPVDSAFYYVDRPETPMNIGALCIFDGHIDFEALTHYVDARIHQAPRYQQRVVQAALSMGQPTWIFDPDFYIGNHVLRVTVDPPGTDEQLRELCGHLLSSTLDRGKPLWEVYVVDGLPGKTGVFFKVHHCMVDGLSAVEIFTMLMDLTPETTPPGRKPLYDPPELPNPMELLVDSVVRDIPHKLNVLQKIGSDVFKLGSTLLDPEKRLKALIGMAYLANNNLTPIKKLPINGVNTGRQTMVWAEFLLSEVRAIRSGTKASINDVMLTVLSGAIDSYVRKHGGTEQPFVRVLCPVNVRMEQEKGTFGNRISVIPVDIPFGISDPLQRLTAITEFTQVMKGSALTGTMDLILTFPSLAPAPIQPLIWGAAPLAFSLLAHTWCTNVAGAQIPVYLLGHQMEHCFGYFPLNPSMGMACVVLSYNQYITMNIVVDTGIIPDPEELAEGLRQSFMVLRRAAKVPEMAPVQVARVSSAETPPPPPLPEPAPARLPAESNGSVVVNAPAVTVSVPVPASAEATTPQDAPAGAASLSGDAPAVPVQQTRHSAEVVIERHAAPPQPAAADDAARGFKLFSDEWAQAFHDAINASRPYRNASQGWTLGSLAFVMRAAPRYGFTAPAAVLMDLNRGQCRSAHAVSVQEAMQAAAFVIEGDYPSWMEALSGRTSPLVMLASGKLRLKKGALPRLLPFTQSAQELVRCAQKVPHQ